MPTFKANDGVRLHYETHGDSKSKALILLHGFTGSGRVFKRNVDGLSQQFHVVVLDLRGHGQSEKPRAGYHVARLALDLRNLVEHLQLPEGQISAIGTSLGAAILWSYCELFTSKSFSHVIYVDQAPLQNYLSDWGPEYGNRGLNNPQALADVQRTLETDPKTAHLGTIAACLGYRSHPQADDPTSDSQTWQDDEAFFLGEALEGDGWWYGKLMGDHTALDWRDAVAHAFGPGSGSTTKTLVIASTRSGCFPAAGPLKVVELANGGTEGGLARGVAVEWGGHWCYWEDPVRFNDMVIEFLSE
ncbi:alpha/beta-hydrolase [Didymella exigua CBS 183.55]|uniref:Alpha/beta-hydrolase n=1 Tax=Didymella exigua CBS 183.55 TaxID=1150837 RepID=A0A6A5R7M7_9PLEO|nr:alpha/beta-hydrolase [Didymella exigua CBS 183.55]KAF1923339.1 alpha/beta-hydrolase [Didymella exigua CBS 183.55]